MTQNNVLEAVRRQLESRRRPSNTQIAALLDYVAELECQHQHEQELVLQANLDRRAYRALEAANDALIATRHVDAAERRRAEDALRESEERFRVLFEHSPDSIVVIDPHHPSGEWPIVDCNDLACKWNGYTREEVIGQSIDLFHVQPATVEERAAYLERLRHEGSVHLEAIHRRKDGSLFAVEISTTLITVNGRELVLGIDRDISERRHTEEDQHFLNAATGALQSSLDYRATLQCVADLAVPYLGDWCVVLMVEEDDSVLPVALAHANGTRHEEARGILERLPSVADALPGVADVLRTGTAVVIAELGHAPRAAGEAPSLSESFHVRSGMSVPMMARGRLLGVLTLVSAESGRSYGDRDLHLAEELGRRAALAVDNARLYHDAQQALRARDDFLANAAHELKAPLTTIFGSARMLQRWASHEEEQGLHALKVLALAETAAQNLEKLIDSLIDLSRIQSGRFNLERRPVDLCALSRLVVEETPTTPRHTIELDCADQHVIVEGDEARLELVLHNLLGNALKYSPHGGRVIMRIERDRQQARFTVTDKGIGIPQAAQAHLFERFFRAGNADQARIGGTGIGLYLVHEIVTRHGGSIEVSSREGEGSTFTVCLPLWTSRRRTDFDQSRVGTSDHIHTPVAGQERKQATVEAGPSS